MKKMLTTVLTVCLLAINGVAQQYAVSSNGKTAFLNFYYTAPSNGDTLRTVFYWDTLPNMYRQSSPIRKTVYQQGFAYTEYTAPVLPCKIYYSKVVYICGSDTGMRDLTFFTPGIAKPDFNAMFEKVGFTFAQLTVFPDGSCNDYRIQVSYNELGRVPVTIYDQYSSNNISVPVALMGLDPNKSYSVDITISNALGETKKSYGFTTMSNLYPEIESLFATEVSSTETQLEVEIDPHGTQTVWTIEYGTDINLGQQIGWMPAFNKGTYITSLFNLQPNTVYYWRAVAKNDFGHYNGRIRMFRTNGTLGMTEITPDDLLHIGSYTNTLRLWSDIEIPVQVMTLSGQVIYSEKISSEITDVSLTPGIYIVHANINGTSVSKKIFVN